MELTGEFFNAFENFLNPDFFDRIGRALGVPADKVRAAVTTAIPAVFEALKKSTATKSGAQSVVNAIHEGGFDHASEVLRTGDGAPASLDPAALGAEVARGTDFLGHILGDKVGSLTRGVASVAGVSTTMAGKAVGLASTAVLSFFGTRLRGTDGSPAALMSLVNQVAAEAPPAAVAPKAASRAAPWILAALLAIGAAWLFSRPPAPTVTAQNAPVSIPSGTVVVDSISKFLALPNAGLLPRSFSFRDLDFHTGSAALDQEAQAVVVKLAGVLIGHPTARVRIEGNTDNTGDSAANLSLSKARADAVRDLLVKAGVPIDRIETAGMGSNKPLVSNDTVEGRQVNRRTDIVVLSN